MSYERIESACPTYLYYSTLIPLLPFFSVAKKRSLLPAFKNDEYEVRGAAGTMDPLTPNWVVFPGLAGLACRS